MKLAVELVILISTMLIKYLQLIIQIKNCKIRKSCYNWLSGKLDPGGDNFLQTFLLNPENFKKSDDNNIESYKLYNNYPKPVLIQLQILLLIYLKYLSVSLKVYDVMGKGLKH